MLRMRETHRALALIRQQKPRVRRQLHGTVRQPSLCRSGKDFGHDASLLQPEASYADLKHPNHLRVKGSTEPLVFEQLAPGRVDCNVCCSEALQQFSLGDTANAYCFAWQRELREMHASEAWCLCGLTTSISGGAQRRPLHAVVRRRFPSALVHLNNLSWLSHLANH